jgi:hypothetical protein
LLGSIINDQPIKDIWTVQITLDSASSMDVVLNKTSNLPLNITNSRQIAVIGKQHSIRVDVFAYSVDGNHPITLPTLIRIHHHLIVCPTFSVVSSKIQNRWMMTGVVC